MHRRPTVCRANLQPRLQGLDGGGVIRYGGDIEPWTWSGARIRKLLDLGVEAAAGHHREPGRARATAGAIGHLELAIAGAREGSRGGRTGVGDALRRTRSSGWTASPGRGLVPRG